MNGKRAIGGAVLAIALAGASAPAGADDSGPPWAEPVIAEFSGGVSVEGRGFVRPPLFPGQRRHGVSLALEPEFYVEWDDYTSITAAPFLRLDSADPERSHADMRELYLRIVRDDWELGAGIGKLFWGVAESFHLVDIVNQTDLIENIDLEDKLGQPMVDLTLVRDWGYIDLVYMPWFRERTFQGRRGRLRNALVIDGGRAVHESGAGRRAPSVALRYANSFGGWDVGVYRFHGTAREPSFLPRIDSSGAVVLAPFYERIDQTGLDAQYTAGAWLWKLEALYRRGQRDRFGRERDYTAAVGGFEYTLYGIFESAADLGLLVEHLLDSRGPNAATAFQNDLFAGARLGFNDAEDTAVLAGVVHDLDGGGRLFTVEASRRIGDSLKLTVEARLFTDVARHDILRDFRGDDLIQVVVGYFY